MKKYVKPLFVTLLVLLSFVLVANPVLAQGSQEFNGSGAGEMNREIEEDGGDEEQSGDDEEAGGDEEQGGDDEEAGENHAGAGEESVSSDYYLRFNLYTRFGWGSSDYSYDYEKEGWSNHITSGIMAHGVYGGIKYVFTIPVDTEISTPDGCRVNGVFFSAIDGNTIRSTYSDMEFSNPVTVFICEGDCSQDVYGNWMGEHLTEIGSFTRIVDFTAILE